MVEKENLTSGVAKRLSAAFRESSLEFDDRNKEDGEPYSKLRAVGCPVDVNAMGTRTEDLFSQLSELKHHGPELKDEPCDCESDLVSGKNKWSRMKFSAVQLAASVHAHKLLSDIGPDTNPEAVRQQFRKIAEEEEAKVGALKEQHRLQKQQQQSKLRAISESAEKIAQGLGQKEKYLKMAQEDHERITQLLAAYSARKGNHGRRDVAASGSMTKKETEKVFALDQDIGKLRRQLDIAKVDLSTWQLAKDLRKENPGPIKRQDYQSPLTLPEPSVSALPPPLDCGAFYSLVGLPSIHQTTEQAKDISSDRPLFAAFQQLNVDKAVMPDYATAILAQHMASSSTSVSRSITQCQTCIIFTFRVPTSAAEQSESVVKKGKRPVPDGDHSTAAAAEEVVFRADLDPQRARVTAIQLETPGTDWPIILGLENPLETVAGKDSLLCVNQTISEKMALALLRKKLHEQFKTNHPNVLFWYVEDSLLAVEWTRAATLFLRFTPEWPGHGGELEVAQVQLSNARLGSVALGSAEDAQSRLTKAVNQILVSHLFKLEEAMEDIGLCIKKEMML